MTRAQKIIRPKLGVRELAKQLGSVSQACKIRGCPRDSLYRFKGPYGAGGERALQEISRRKPILKTALARRSSSPSSTSPSSSRPGAGRASPTDCASVA